MPEGAVAPTSEVVLPRVLIVEDNREIGEAILHSFGENGFAPVLVGDARAALDAMTRDVPDLVVLDRMLPDGEGLSLLGPLRKLAPNAPVIVLSALTTVEDRVAGLDQGADDYLAKPFAVAELLARARALLRRGADAALVLEVGDLKLDLRTREVERADRRIELTGAQFRLLEFLMRHTGQIVNRKMILEHVWEPGVESATNVVDVYINRLRNKIDKGARNPLIHTVRGLGYVLKES